MAGVTVEAPDASRVGDSLVEAGEALSDLSEPSRDAAALALGEVRAPVKTGALARTVEAEATALGFTLTAGGPTAPYAAPVHARDPFLTRPLTAREGDVVDIYADFVDNTLDNI